MELFLPALKTACRRKVLIVYELSSNHIFGCDTDHRLFAAFVRKAANQSLSFRARISRRRAEGIPGESAAGSGILKAVSSGAKDLRLSSRLVAARAWHDQCKTPGYRWSENETSDNRA